MWEWERGSSEWAQVSLWGDENGLELGGGDGCSTLWINHVIVHFKGEFYGMNYGFERIQI